MHRDFGYMEEGKLGKPYNLRLLKRLVDYAIPYKKTVVVCLLLAILITMLNLVLPYFSKIAIDRYILSSWYSINISMMGKDTLKEFQKKYGHLTEEDESGNYALIPNSNIKRIDPADLYKYRSKGFITDEHLYKACVDNNDIALLMDDIEEFPIKMKDGSIALPIENLKKLEPKDILRIRSADFRGLTFVGIAFLCILILSLILGYWENYLLEFVGQNIMQDIRLNLFKRMQSRAISFFNRHPVGQLVTRGDQ